LQGANATSPESNGMASARASPVLVRQDGQSWVNRWIEVLIASVHLLSLLPVVIIVAVVIRVSSAGPVLFRQERVGTASTCATALLHT
jgi:lipopolysaccharide/colanic/teichoic acid biosynthesis glycosyltransferase